MAVPLNLKAPNVTLVINNQWWEVQIPSMFLFSWANSCFCPYDFGELIFLAWGHVF